MMKYTIFLSIIAAASALPNAVDRSINNGRVQDILMPTSSNIDPRPSTTAEECSETRTRVEWRNMTRTDRSAFVSAINCLMSAPPKTAGINATSRYDELVSVHNSMMNWIHGPGYFLPWHRYFVAGYEGLLRDECGYAGAFPWWHEVQDHVTFNTSGLFTPEYFGSLPMSMAPPDQEADSWCVTDGAFTNRTVRIGFDHPQCLSRGEDLAATELTTPARLDACHANVTTFAEHETCSNSGIHISTHVAVGAILAYVPGSVNDPLFFVHHAFVDWAWMRWQRVDEARWGMVSGCTTLPGDEECTEVTEDTVLSTRGIFPDMTVGEVLNPRGSLLCYDYDFY